MYDEVNKAHEAECATRHVPCFNLVQY